MSFTAFLARLHAAPIPPLCREGALARTFGALAAAPRATGTRALIAFSLLEHVAFHLRRGNVACAAEATELVRAAIGPTPMLERLEARVERLRGLAGPSGHVQPSPYRGMTEP